MGRSRDLKEIRDTKKTFHAKMGTINYRNGTDHVTDHALFTRLIMH